MTIIDTSGWLEYFTGGPNSDFFSTAIKKDANIIIRYIEKKNSSKSKEST
jgi:hypothetical protein